MHNYRKSTSNSKFYGKTGSVLKNVKSLYLRSESSASLGQGLPSPTTGIEHRSAVTGFEAWYTVRILLLQNVNDMYRSKTGHDWEGIEKETNSHLMDTAYRLCGKNWRYLPTAKA